MAFGDDVQRFNGKTGIKFNLLVRELTTELTAELVPKTPVDTGWARSNYFFNADQDTTSIEETRDEEGEPSFARCAQFVSKLKAGGVYYITNNLHYILKITEYGGSPNQAAPGMLTALVGKYQAIVRRIVAELS